MALTKNYSVELNYYCDGIHNNQALLSLYPDLVNNIKKELTLDKVYIMVNTIEGTKDKIEFKVYVYTDETKECVLDIKHYSFTPVVDQDSYNFIKQAYLYMKTLPEYEDAVDC